MCTVPDDAYNTFIDLDMFKGKNHVSSFSTRTLTLSALGSLHIVQLYQPEGWFVVVVLVFGCGFVFVFFGGVVPAALMQSASFSHL